MKKNFKIILLVVVGILIIGSLVSIICVLGSGSKHDTMINIEEYRKSSTVKVVKPTQASEDEYVCEVDYDGSARAFTSFEEGWKFANIDCANKKSVKFILRQDWIAVDGKFGEPDGEEKAFTYTGAICFNERAASNYQFTLDLSGYKIDRGLTEYIEAGEVIKIHHAGNFSISNGYITGAASTTCGGGIYIEAGSVRLTNLTIYGNVTTLEGAGVYILYGSPYVRMTNMTIQENYAGSYGGGVFITEGNGYNEALDISGKMIINLNEGKSDKNNLCVTSGRTVCFAYTILEGSSVGLSTTSKDSILIVRSKFDDVGIEGFYESLNYFYSDASTHVYTYGVLNQGDAAYGLLLEKVSSKKGC